MSTPHIDWSAFYLTFFKSLAQAWEVWLLFGLVILGKLGYEIYQHNRLARTGIYEIDKMNGEEFEERLKILYENLGFKATRTGGRPGGDYGVDLVVEKDGVKTAIQAKCYKNRVGEDAVREANTGKRFYYCNKAQVITNSNFTPMAWQLARANYVWLTDRKGLIKLLLTEKTLQQKA